MLFTLQLKQRWCVKTGRRWRRCWSQCSTDDCPLQFRLFWDQLHAPVDSRRRDVSCSRRLRSRELSHSPLDQ